MAVDFSKIFSQNSPSTPFTWTDAEYLQGWDVIQNTPPTRQQFNALQKISDEKDLELYNTKAPKHSPVFTGDPQAPTPAKNDNDKSLATTAFVQTWVKDLVDRIEDNGVGIVASSVSNPGYIKFGNGVIIQWGWGNTGPTGYTTFNLPISFTTMYVGVGNDNCSTTVNNFHIVAVDNTDLSRCTIGGRETDGSSALSGTAIGAIFMGY